MPSVPWPLTSEYLDDVEQSVAPLLGPEVATLMRPTLRPAHRSIVETISGLAWAEDAEPAAHEAFTVLRDATQPDGVIDPADDAADVPWCGALRRLLVVPVLGSTFARRWFGHLMRLRWDDIPVSTITEGVAAYGVALMEHLGARPSEAQYWMRVAAVQNEDDDRCGLGIAVVVRAARLLSETKGLEAASTPHPLTVPEALGFRSATSESAPTSPMVRVQLRRFAEPDPTPTWIAGDVRAVPAEPFADADHGEGGITRGDIVDDALIAPLRTYRAGAEIYVESEDQTDCLDDETPEAECTTHIWWKAILVGHEAL